NAVDIPRCRIARDERGVGPAVDQRKRLESARRRDEPRTVEPRKALGIAERSARGLDIHDTAGHNMYPPLSRVAEIDGDIDISQRAQPRRQRERYWIGPGGGNGAPELHDARDLLCCGKAGAERGVGP